MAKCKSKKCGCRKSRIVSGAALSEKGRCVDVCTNAPCGTPNTLSVMAPVIYDEIGINLCATFGLGIDLSTAYPTADKIRLSVTDIGFTFGTDIGQVSVEAIVGRPNCYLVTLSNLEVQFVAGIYDYANRLLGTTVVTATYLPALITDETYDEDTNPTSVELEIYAPYGPAYTVDTTTAPPTATAIISLITFGAENTVSQGINIMAIPKVLDFDIDADTITVGLSVFLQSLYYAAYKVPTEGRLETPKGNIATSEQSLCMDFVDGSLLDLCIRPLVLDAPECEGSLKQDCDFDNDCCCNQQTPIMLQMEENSELANY